MELQVSFVSTHMFRLSVLRNGVASAIRNDGSVVCKSPEPVARFRYAGLDKTLSTGALSVMVSRFAGRHNKNQ
jgi:hypothetical protein